MGVETVDKRFALIANNNDLLFPYKKKQKSTNRYGFALTAPGEQDRAGGGHYTLDIEDVVKRLVFDGWSVRAMTGEKQEKKREGSAGIGKKNFIGYWISDELKHLVKNAKISPIPLPGVIQKNYISPLNILNQYKSNTEADASTRGQTDQIDEASNSEKSLLVELIDASSQIEHEYQNSPGEDVDAIVKRRIGQGLFRALLERDRGIFCWITGLAHGQLLIASHIVPWSKSLPMQKTDPDNGLLLSVCWDALFDKGFISFDDEGRLLCSDLIDEDTVKRLGISLDSHLASDLMTEGRRKNLAWHREKYAFDL